MPLAIANYEHEFTSLQLADWFIPFLGADLKIPTNHSEEHYNGTGVRLGYPKVPFGVSSYPLFKELAIWPNLQRVSQDHPLELYSLVGRSLRQTNQNIITLVLPRSPVLSVLQGFLQGAPPMYHFTGVERRGQYAYRFQ